MDIVFMAPNGQLILGTPLAEIEQPGKVFGTNMDYSIYVCVRGPLAYILHADKYFKPQVFAAEWVDKKLINLGVL